eukprot:scaffold43383_cov18-Prasinocladus_malaysianus.AAC.1
MKALLSANICISTGLALAFGGVDIWGSQSAQPPWPCAPQAAAVGPAWPDVDVPPPGRVRSPRGSPAIQPANRHT